MCTFFRLPNDRYTIKQVHTILKQNSWNLQTNYLKKKDETIKQTEKVTEAIWHLW